MGLIDYIRKKINARQEHISDASVPSVAEIMSELGLTLFVVADLHTCHWEDMTAIQNALEKYSYDCVLFLGDIFMEDVKEIAFYSIAPSYYVLGNHDYWGQNERISGLTNIDGRVEDVYDVRIGGLSGGPRYKEGNFAMRTQEQAYDAIRKLGDTDILVTHESPYHLINTNSSHSGFQAITDYIEEKKPKLHIFGHHHIQEETQLGETREICVYKCAILSPDGVRQII